MLVCLYCTLIVVIRTSYLLEQQRLLDDWHNKWNTAPPPMKYHIHHNIEAIMHHKCFPLQIMCNGLVVASSQADIVHYVVRKCS